MAGAKNGHCVLITNAFIENWSGSELYVRDVAFELIKRGHKPIVYSPRIGKLAEELGKKSIPIVSDLNSIGYKPDLIHGQHHLETMTALARFPETPAVFFCHGWLPWEETPPLHPRIDQYVAVSDALRERLIYECGIASERVTTILNSVDMERFHSRPPLPDIPRKALVFNNRVNETNILDTILKACALNGMSVEVMGYGSGNPCFEPEERIGTFDIVFAVGRAALESLAVGTAVICCGLEGVGQMVTTENLEWLRRNNFGIRVLNQPLDADVIAAEIRRYDPADALAVSRKVRETAGHAEMVDQILGMYGNVLSSGNRQDIEAEGMAFSAYMKGLSENIYKIIAEKNLALHNADILQKELQRARERSIRARERSIRARERSIRARERSISGLFKRFTRFFCLRNLYEILITHKRHRSERPGKQKVY